MLSKALIGPRLRARGFAAQQIEDTIGVAVLNRMLAAGSPDSVRRQPIIAYQSGVWGYLDLQPPSAPTPTATASYRSTISTRRFCGSRTPSAVWTNGRVWPKPCVVIASRGTPKRTSSAATFCARRIERPWL